MPGIIQGGCSVNVYGMGGACVEEAELQEKQAHRAGRWERLFAPKAPPLQWRRWLALSSLQRRHHYCTMHSQDFVGKHDLLMTHRIAPTVPCSVRWKRTWEKTVRIKNNACQKDKLEVFVLNICSWPRMDSILEYSSKRVIRSVHLSCVFHTFVVQKMIR